MFKVILFLLVSTYLFAGVGSQIDAYKAIKDHTITANLLTTEVQTWPFYGTMEIYNTLEVNTGIIASDGTIEVLSGLDVNTKTILANTVGIGTVTPTSILEVNGTAEIPVIVGNYGSSGTLELRANSSGTSGNILLNPNGGKVGIGTTSPSYILEVNGSIRGSHLLFKTNEINEMLDNSDHGNIWINYSGYQDGTTYYRDLYVGNGKHVALMTIEGFSGRVGIGTTSPSEMLDVNGTIECVHVTETSDERLKKNIKKITEKSTEKIMRLEPKIWDWKDGSGSGIGFVAQDIETIIPEAVVKHNDTEETRAIVPSIILLHAVKTIQEQQLKIEELEERLKKLENK